jgi:hypothetical protein
MFIGGPITTAEQSWSAPDQTIGFGSIIVFNPSASPVDVFLGQNGRQGSPNFSVPAGTAVTYPIPGTSYVTVAYETYPTIGVATVNLVDTVLSAASSIIPFSSGATKLAATGFVTFGSGAALNWGVTPTLVLAATAADVTFAQPYNLAVFAIVTGIIVDNDGGDANTIPSVFVYNLTLTGAGLYVGGMAYPDTPTGRAFFMAIGV